MTPSVYIYHLCRIQGRQRNRQPQRHGRVQIPWKEELKCRQKLLILFYSCWFLVQFLVHYSSYSISRAGLVFPTCWLARRHRRSLLAHRKPRKPLWAARIVIQSMGSRKSWGATTEPCRTPEEVSIHAPNECVARQTKPVLHEDGEGIMLRYGQWWLSHCNDMVGRREVPGVGWWRHAPAWRRALRATWRNNSSYTLELKCLAYDVRIYQNCTN